MNTMPRPHHSSAILHHLSLLTALLIFITLSLHQLVLPGLHYDEAREAGVNAMQLATGQPVTAFRDATVQVGSWRLPLMVQDYIGTLDALLAVPFLFFGGVNVVALRLLSVTIGAMTLVMTWRLAWSLGGSSAAAIAGLLLAINPTFVFWSRQGIFVTNLVALLFMASLLTALQWWRARRRSDLWLTAFLWGLGIYAKLLFVWAIGAMTAIGVMSWAVRRWRSAPAASRASSRQPVFCTYLITVLSFLLPLIPLILFNLQTSGTLISIFGNLGRSYYGVDNRAYLPNLLLRLDQLRTLLLGDHLWYLGEVYANRVAPWIGAGMLVAWGVVWAWRRRRQPHGSQAGATQAAARKDEPMVSVGALSPVALLPVALLALIIAQSAFTVSDLFITHYALVVPLISLSAGLIAGSLLRSVPRFALRLLPSALIVALAAWWGLTDLANTIRYHQILAIAGGYGTHSDAIYNLASYLQQQGPSAPLALDWGIDAPVRYLTVGRANPIEVFGYEKLDAPDPGFAGRVGPFMDNPDNLYVAHAGDFAIFRGRVEELGGMAAARGMRLQEVARFGERSGRLLFVVYRVSKGS